MVREHIVLAPREQRNDAIASLVRYLAAVDIHTLSTVICGIF